MVGMAEYAIITGLSGAGRSQAGATLEDLGWFVIDNMPTALITKVAGLVAGPSSIAAAHRPGGRPGRRPDQ